MPEVPLHSVAFHPFDATELHAIRAVARLDRSVEALTASVVRVQFLRATMGNTLGASAEKGLALIECFLLFLLGSLPAADGDAIRSKALIFRCVTDEPDNVSAMLCAALEADSRRIGLMLTADPSADEPLPH